MEKISKSAFEGREKIIKKAIIKDGKYLITLSDGTVFILIEDPQTIKKMSAEGDTVADWVVSVTIND